MDGYIKQKLANQVRTNLIFPKGRYFILITHKTDKPLKKGSIIDVETTGLDPQQDHIITLGILKGNQARILQLIKPNYTRFQNLCHYTAQEQPKPHHAYASQFEQQFLRTNTATSDWHDLNQYFEVEYDYENPLRRCRLADCTTHPFPSEPYDIDGPQVPQAWQLWLRTKDANFLTDIVWHSLCDLLRTQQLVARKRF